MVLNTTSWGSTSIALMTSPEIVSTIRERSGSLVRIVAVCRNGPRAVLGVDCNVTGGRLVGSEFRFVDQAHRTLAGTPPLLQFERGVANVREEEIVALNLGVEHRPELKREFGNVDSWTLCEPQNACND